MKMSCLALLLLRKPSCNKTTRRNEEHVKLLFVFLQIFANNHHTFLFLNFITRRIHSIYLALGQLFL
jgi:hypothetical protein